MKGLMIKDPESAYTPGRRGLSWLKLKMAFDTLDCVVVGAEYGHGKRKDVLSDYTFAVRDDSRGELKTIGKPTAASPTWKLRNSPPIFSVTLSKPTDVIMKWYPTLFSKSPSIASKTSTRHTSGLAMRFPRILRIRRDKKPGSNRHG